MFIFRVCWLVFASQWKKSPLLVSQFAAHKKVNFAFYPNSLWYIFSMMSRLLVESQIFSKLSIMLKDYCFVQVNPPPNVSLAAIVLPNIETDLLL